MTCPNCHDYVMGSTHGPYCHACKRTRKRTGQYRVVSFGEALETWHRNERARVRVVRIDEYIAANGVFQHEKRTINENR